MKNQADRDFLRPLWRRLAVVIFLALWMGYEAIFIQETLWLVIVGGTLAYAVWNFFINWKDEDPAPPPA